MRLTVTAPGDRGNNRNPRGPAPSHKLTCLVRHSSAGSHRMEPENTGDHELPFEEPELPARDAWRKLIGEPPRLTCEEVEAWRREIDSALERVYPAIASGKVEQALGFLQDCPALAQS